MSCLTRLKFHNLVHDASADKVVGHHWFLKWQDNPRWAFSADIIDISPNVLLLSNVNTRTDWRNKGLCGLFHQYLTEILSSPDNPWEVIQCFTEANNTIHNNLLRKYSWKITTTLIVKGKKYYQWSKTLSPNKLEEGEQ